jgi:hypothetical protein
MGQSMEFNMDSYGFDVLYKTQTMAIYLLLKSEGA